MKPAAVAAAAGAVFRGIVMSMQRGFTLIELMIALVIIGIIAGIAFDAFSGAGKDSQRARAMADITALNDAMARFYQTSFTYTGAVADASDVAARTFAGASGIALSNQYDYAVTVSAVAPVGQAYTITAAPDAGGELVGDGALLVDELGNRCYYPGNDTPPPLFTAINCSRF